MAEQPKSKGGGEKGIGRKGKNAGSEKTRIKTLAEQKIDKNLADRARPARLRAVLRRLQAWPFASLRFSS
jgi:hypothetical protein